MTKKESAKNQFARALSRLEEVLALPKNDVVRDSAIQRFEFSVDLAWKALKITLQEDKGIVCASPKECVKEAFRQGLIEYSDAWLEFIDMRNETSHTYQEEIAEKIFQKLPQALEYFKKILFVIEGK